MNTQTNKSSQRLTYLVSRLIAVRLILDDKKLKKHIWANRKCEEIFLVELIQLEQLKGVVVS